MRKFRFKFATLEKARKQAQDSAMRMLAEAQRAFHAAVDHRAQLVHKLEDSLLRREGLGAQPTSVSAFLLENDFITGTKQRIIRAEQGIFRARKGVEKALRNYLNARRQTRAIELLREKAFREFKKEMSRKEQRELDDLTLMRHRLKNVEEGEESQAS